MNEEWAYIARTTTPIEYWPEVGTAIAAAVDRPQYAKDTAKAVAEWVRDGLTVERVTVAWCRKHLFTADRFEPTPPGAPMPDCKFVPDPFCAPWWEDGVDGYEIGCPNCNSGISQAPEMTPNGWRCDWCTEEVEDDA